MIKFLTLSQFKLSLAKLVEVRDILMINVKHVKELEKLRKLLLC